MLRMDTKSPSFTRGVCDYTWQSEEQSFGFKSLPIVQGSVCSWYLFLYSVVMKD